MFLDFSRFKGNFFFFGEMQVILNKIYVELLFSMDTQVFNKLDSFKAERLE